VLITEISALLTTLILSSSTILLFSRCRVVLSYSSVFLTVSHSVFSWTLSCRAYCAKCFKTRKSVSPVFCACDAHVSLPVPNRIPIGLTDRVFRLRLSSCQSSAAICSMVLGNSLPLIKSGHFLIVLTRLSCHF